MDNNFKSGFVSLIGRPNVGKSTLMNALIGQKIAITSNKPQTTRNRIQTVYTDERCQIIFLDTPGVNKAKNKLGEFMLSVAERTISEVDVILWLVEPTTFIGGGERHIIEKLKKAKAPVILVINKVDMLKKSETGDGSVSPITKVNRQSESFPKGDTEPSPVSTKGDTEPSPVSRLEEIINTYTKEYDFAEVITISALRGKNTMDVIDLIYKYLPYGPQYFDEDTITDQPMKQIVAEIIREKSLHALQEEIPHGIAVVIDSMKTRDSGITDIEATIICEKDSHKGIIIGKQGSMLKKIGSTAQYEIERLIEGKANLQLWVKVKKDWRDSEVLLKNYGYTETGGEK